MVWTTDFGLGLPFAGHGSGLAEPVSPEIVIRISEPALFAVCFCIAMAALLAFLAVRCDKDGNVRAK